MQDDARRKSLHQEILRKHYRASPHRGPPDPTDDTATVDNPTCGDIVTVALRLRDGRIERVRIGGHGCTISQASASMMAAAVEGCTPGDAARRAAAFRALVRGEPRSEADPPPEEWSALSGVARLPGRLRCALLGWDALALALGPRDA